MMDKAAKKRAEEATKRISDMLSKAPSLVFDQVPVKELPLVSFNNLYIIG